MLGGKYEIIWTLKLSRLMCRRGGKGLKEDGCEYALNFKYAIVEVLR